MPYDGATRFLTGAAGDDAGAPRPRPRLVGLWRRRRQRERERGWAARWSERELRDLGVTPGDVWRELRVLPQPIDRPG